MRRVPYIKPSTNIAFGVAVVSGIFNLLYCFVNMSSHNAFQTVIMILSCAFGLLGAYLTSKRRKSAASSLLVAAIITAGLILTGYEKIFPFMWGLGYAVASINDFQLINIKTPMPDDFYDPDMWDKQTEGLKRVNEFIAHYGALIYYGYLLIAISCMSLFLFRLFAGETVYGFKREIFALMCSFGLTALCALMTEISRKDIK